MNKEEIKTLRKAFREVIERQKKNKPKDFEERIKRLRKVREFSVINEELLKQAVENLQENDIEVYFAKDSAEAIDILLNKVDDDLVVKSKSNISKEIKLTEILENKGFTVVETDIGDRIMQLLRVKPSHPTGPIVHLSASFIAKELSKIFNKSIKEDPKAIVDFIKRDIEGYINKAKVGITGANAVSAEEGSIVLLHNEGNIFKVAKREKHIIITGIDKIYPNLEEVLNMLKILNFNATGTKMPSFIEIVSGISKTADVEKKIFKGVHEPKEIVLILLDNGRSKIVESEFKEILYCINCGNCLINCPMYNVVGNEYAVDNHLGGRGLVYYSLVNDKAEKLEYCLTCGRCKKSCPLNIDIPKMVRRIRSGKNVPKEIYYFIKSHYILAKELLKI